MPSKKEHTIYVKHCAHVRLVRRKLTDLSLGFLSHTIIRVEQLAEDNARP